MRLANPNKHHEAITSRPLLMHAVAKQTKHGGQTFLTITSPHAKAEKVRGALLRLSMFLGHIRSNAEQLSIAERMRIVAMHAFRKIIGTLNVNLGKLLPQTVVT